MVIGTLPGNRFNNPDESFVDTTGLPYAGGFLYFYASNTSTPQNTYNNADLDSAHANANPVTLDSAGRLPNAVWLQALAYKVVLTDSNLNQIWSADPVYTSDYSTIAQFQTYAGNPNGNVAGTAGSGSVLSSVVWDRSNNLLYVCTTSGVAAAAVWTQVAASFPSAIVFSGVITPTILSANTNDWAPTGFSSAYLVRASADAARNLTGLAGGATGREVVLSNVGTNNITLLGNSSSSNVGNRFVFPRPIVLRPADALSLNFDATSNGWRAKEPLVAQPIAGGYKNLKVACASATVATVTADAIILEDANGESYRAQTVSTSIDITSNGANGLDTGAEASSTWYSIWTIYNPTTNTVAGLLSVSSTLSSITLPSGYTFGARNGWVRNDGSSNFLRFIQYGRIAQYTVGTNPAVAPNIANASGGVVGTYSNTSPTLATASITSVVPTATAAAIYISATNQYKAGAAGADVLLAPTTAWGGTNNGPGGSAGQVWPLWLLNNAAGEQSQTVRLTVETTTVAWCSDTIGGAISCLGWEDSL